MVVCKMLYLYFIAHCIIDLSVHMAGIVNKTEQNKEYVIDPKLQIRIQKRRVYVVDGIISYPIAISNGTITCLCSSLSRSRTGGTKLGFCKHVCYYLYHKGLDFDLLDYWIRLKHNILSELESPKVNNEKLWNIVDKEILAIDCGFCLEKIRDPSTSTPSSQQSSRIHICSECQGIVHTKCFNKWNNSGNGCMLCRAGAKVK
ncbi:hypothetical protein YASMINEVIRUS_1213 [Yasminevirus sp. GU-2018]|uniref:RING-type domain-containing protein n=1 Tax=Yasminevirus sp. GU-2018 TaxID=2420051 RepID=A0A5K0UAW6_9VIRU|nr:hypothetical protein YASMINEVIRUS_1213 [Yasminevirus sp. GU-2018]